MGLLTGLVVLLVVLGFVTLVGHGIWLVLAALWNGVFGPPPRRPAPHPPRRRWRTCPGCRGDLLPGDRDCPHCTLDLDGPLAAEARQLRVAQWEVRDLALGGELDRPTADQVAALLDRRVQALMDGRKPRPATARPRAKPAEPAPAEPPALDLPPSVVGLPPFPGFAGREPSPPAAPLPRARPVPAADSAEPPTPPRRHGVLAAFMEQRNILWGEVVGGLLIVGCSIALVVTLWKQLEALPYFPFLLATAITAGLFGAGQYTLHHWRLESTSRGLLVIALLLAPLNLLLLATPGADAGGGWLDAAVKVAAVVLFVGMVRAAGRDLIGTDLLPGPVDRRWLLALAMVGAPASQALPAAWAGGLAGPVPVWLPLACHVVACAAVLAGLTLYRPRESHEPIGTRRAWAVLTFVGMSLFALLAAWGLVLTRTADQPATLLGLALPLVLAGVPVTEAGLLVQRRADHANLRATGTGAALAGSVLLAVGVALAWPDPLRLMLVAAVAGAQFTRVAWRDRLPWFHAGAVPALGLAAVLAAHGLLGQWATPDGVAPGERLKDRLGSATSGMTLAGLALVLAGVAEAVVRRGNRPQALGYALGGLAVGVVALLLVSVHGVEDPWPAVAVHAACAAGLLAANVRWRRQVLAQAGLWLVLVGTLWAAWAVAPEDRPTWGLVLAVESLALAAGALALTPRAARPDVAGVVFRQLRVACRDVAAGAGVVAVVLTLAAPGFPHGWPHAATLLTLAPVGLLLARVYARPWPTWAGSAAALAGLLHLTVYAVEVRPVGMAVLLALLGHATLAVAGSLALRGKPSRVRLFADPLRLSALVTSAVAALFLPFPPAGFAFGWSLCAAWLAAVWLALAWAWRERGAFSAALGAMAAAAVLRGVAAVERQEWWATTTLGLSDPRAVQEILGWVGLLVIAWAVARRLARGSGRLAALWLRDPLAVDRLVTAAAVVAHLVLLAVAIDPPVLAELTPAGRPAAFDAPAELAHAFGPHGWQLAGLLAVGLLASLWWSREDEAAGDLPLLALLTLGVSAAVAWAGSFAPQVAAATALRWTLGAAFLVGSAVLWFRDPLGRLARRAGFGPRVTPAAPVAAHVLFGLAAAVVLVVTLNLTQLGLSGLRPSGPVPGTAFARLGYTAAFLIPLGLLVVGLAGNAARERLSEYAFAAGLVFVGTVTSGYALAVVTTGGAIDGVQRVRLGMLAAGGAAAWALLWLAAGRRVPGGPLRAAQAAMGLAGVGLLALVPLVRLFAAPEVPGLGAFAEFGRLGWAVLAVAAWAGFEAARRTAPEVRAHVVGFAAVVAGVLAACAAEAWVGPVPGLSFRAMAAAWAVAGLGLTAALFAAPAVSRGAWVAVLAAGVGAAALVGPVPDAGRWPVPVALGAYALASAALVAALLYRTREADRWDGLALALGIVAVPAVLLGLVATVTGDLFAERLAGPLAVALLAAAAGLLVGAAPPRIADPARLAAVVAAAAGIALVGWAVPDRDAPAVWLQRNGWAFVALVAAAVASLEGLPRMLPRSAWAVAARRVGGWLGLAAMVALGVVLVQQVTVFDPVTRRTPLGLPEVLAILTGVAALIAVALRFALRPAADPLNLPESRRTRYVYLAELLLVLFFVHVRLNLPELFLAQAVRYWTFLVMLLAFVGIGLAELFERRGVTVLARPLRRTGVLLPLIPLLAFWTKPPAFLLEWADGQAPGARPFLGYLEKLPQHFDNYAGLWFLAGLLYGLIALSRRSFGWALLGALAVNAGMWALLAHNEVSAAVHPQVWVIPLALIVLVSEHVNRRELRPGVSAGLRYLGIGMLYVSSAADMFIAGVGESLWLPVVLAGLCVAGILGGIVLRVRAFLFLGVGFLLLDVFAMIWHAAVDRAQTWVWYASGIVLGVAIFALFAVFEKRRNDVAGLVERLRRWD